MNNALRKKNKPKTRPLNLMIDLAGRDRCLLIGQPALLHATNGQLVHCVLAISNYQRQCLRDALERAERLELAFR